MIIEYHRPDTVEAAVELLARKDPVTVPMGGGTVLNQPSDQSVAVVDLQALGLNIIELQGNNLDIGATVTLQQLLNFSELDLALAKAIRHEATYNTRQIATVAGALVSADGRSPLGTAMLALGAQLTLLPGEDEIFLGDLFPLRAETRQNKLISQVRIPSNVKLAYEYVARTPADLPIVCVGVARWNSGRTRVALGGYGTSPILVMDGPSHIGADVAARDAYSEAGDQWASAEYRSDVAATLASRAVRALLA